LRKPLERELEAILQFAVRAPYLQGRYRSKASYRTLGSNRVVGVCNTALGSTAIDRCGSISGAFQGAAVEVWMVEDVEEVHRKLDAIALLERPILGHLHVQICCRGTKASPTLLHGRGGRAEGISDKCEVVRVEDLRPLLTGVAGCTGNGQWPVVTDVAGSDQARDGTTVLTTIR
jgi:hypothetical protein